MNVSLVKEDVAGFGFLVMQGRQEFCSDIAVGFPDYKVVEALWKMVLEALCEPLTWILCGAEANAWLPPGLSESLLVVSGQAAAAAIVQCRFYVFAGGGRHLTQLCRSAVACEGLVFFDQVVDQFTRSCGSVGCDHFIGLNTQPSKVFECACVVVGCNDGTFLAPCPEAGQQSEAKITDVN